MEDDILEECMLATKLYPTNDHLCRERGGKTSLRMNVAAGSYMYIVLYILYIIHTKKKRRFCVYIKYIYYYTNTTIYTCTIYY